MPQSGNNSQDSERLFEIGQDTEVSVKGMTERDIKKAAKNIKVAMKNPSLLRGPSLGDKVARMSVPAKPDLTRFDETLRKTVR